MTLKDFLFINNNGHIKTCVACHFQNTPYIKKNYSQNLIGKFLLSMAGHADFDVTISVY